MAGEGRPPTSLLRGMKKRRGWPAFAGHDTGGERCRRRADRLGDQFDTRHFKGLIRALPDDGLPRQNIAQATRSDGRSIRGPRDEWPRVTWRRQG